ncbi:hypothetical protein BG006_001885 [Podila minutissima]|uniref:Uncharacterized protein n=1 Tax=Podila minutissima TaxID=64525 RepID=A0A9P5ST80_9FUNG|nr:hypothetical protein BG006_001885 [Podila minutissima]
MKTFTFASSLLAMTVVFLSSSSTVMARYGHRASPASYGDCSSNCSSTYTTKVAACESRFPKVSEADKKNGCIQDVGITFQKCEATCMQRQ